MAAPVWRVRASTADRQAYAAYCRQLGVTAATAWLAAGTPLPHSKESWRPYLSAQWEAHRATGEPFPPGDRGWARRIFTDSFTTGFDTTLHAAGRVRRLPYRSTRIYRDDGPAVAAALAGLGYPVDPPAVSGCLVSAVLTALAPPDAAAEEAILAAIGAALGARRGWPGDPFPEEAP